VRRGRGRTKLTWEEAIKRDLKGWDISRYLCLDRSAWKTAIDMPAPLFVTRGSCWVSTLAYPNLLGTKRLCCLLFVVVVVGK
jgi:hypothetical protein